MSAEKYPSMGSEIVRIVGAVKHELDEGGILEEVFIGENPILSVLSHLNLQDGDRIQVTFKRI